MSLRNGMMGLVGRLGGVDVDVVFVAVAYSMKFYEKHLVVDTSSAAVTITLPKVTEAKGRIYTIEAPVGNSDTVTIQSDGDCLNAISDTTSLDSAKSVAAYYSTGRDWVLLAHTA